MHERAATTGRATTLTAAFVIASAMVVLRSAVWLFFEQSFFDSDQAIVGLMAKHLSELRAFPLFSYGENFGAPDCGVPIERFRWLPTRQPVALELWPWDDSPGSAYTTIATWDNRGNDLVWRGEHYGWNKRSEFFKVAELPRQRTVPFEVAAGVPPEDQRLLAHHGWRFIDSLDISSDHETYRRYIGGSRAEFTVAKDQNIRLRSGWFSDRSCCYLAAGRPVINQDTAFGNVLPTGRGLFSFRTLGDVLTAVDAIESDYAGHRRAAREIAGEYFAAEKVLGSLCARAGL